MGNLSAIIITFNEERKIQNCINSVRKVAEDIVVVDSFSKDNTKKICQENGVRFVEREFISYADQKNYAVSLAKYDHILSLDADEYLSEELEKSILQVKETWTHEAYKMNRLSSYDEKWIKNGAWYPDRQLRLWNRKFGSWGGSNPHEKVILQNGTAIKRLRGDLLHRSYDNSEITLNKIQLYSRIFAKSNASKRYISVFGIIVHTSFAFFKSYFIKMGILDGFEGLAVAMAVANHTYYKYAKLYEANRRLKDSKPK
ncbi:MAG TPA: glycosyltransferase family 2 protein [Cyclobacteriaceae bacterium]|nr:glycosyltransferase family 2 protein [Cyclobacteriaceae bacterium]